MCVRTFRWKSGGSPVDIPLFRLALAVISAPFFRSRVHRKSGGMSARRRSDDERIRHAPDEFGVNTGAD